MAEQRRTSPWIYVAVGCGIVLVLGAIAVVGLGYMGFRWAKQVESDMKDPQARTAKALTVLGADRLPQGYEASVAISIPMLMEMVILSDLEVPAGEEPGQGGDLFEERGFMYFRMPSTAGQRRELDDFFEGRIDDAEFLRRSSINLQRGEVLKRGELDLGETHVRWLTQRGSVTGGLGASRQEGLTTTMLIECPGTSRLRMAMWFGPGPEGGGEAADDAQVGEGVTGGGAEATNEVEAGPQPAPGPEPDLAGTVGDETALRDFLGHFRFCER